MLVVSHLHDDHVSGLEYLLKDFEVETVIMPYTNEGLRLMSRTESTSGDGFLQVFYTDPVSWFVSNGVKRVLLIGSNEQDIKDVNQREYIESNDMYVDNQSILGSEVINDTDVFYLKKQSKVTYGNFSWEFLFENLPLQDSSTSDFVKAVENFKKINHLTLEQIFKSKSFTSSLRKELNAKIKGLKDKINRTSVIMLHRPITDSRSIASFIGNNCFCNNLSRFCKCNWLCCTGKCTNVSSLLTGDLTIEGKDMPIMPDFYHHHLILQYPHHGSQRNEIDAFVNLYAFVNVISCGINNRYGHPHVAVIERLSDCVVVNERNAFDYTVSILNGD